MVFLTLKKIIHGFTAASFTMYASGEVFGTQCIMCSCYYSMKVVLEAGCCSWGLEVCTEKGREGHNKTHDD